ncbi:AAA family ATPase [Vagococcus xieshaowenii]|uniref:ABC transporter ATP-binding protein n=1 Tax=Vagococcus xieshaowenii TaxID=2562451 RepID=A0A4Z0D7Q0_9ENTE|nr:AAA family ATPase [Vagococcus xieshaowenii]QCA29144.1 ABC transporter ATP-binding protein [Vagococcus xieshaowenii]TFZ40879.1 ABC transporter ATP-binding protein [Vagococcus xieshaowenii]
MTFVKRVLLQLSKDEQMDYYHELPVIKWLADHDGLILSNKITFISGENGQGKSTFIEALAVAMGMNAEGGSQQFNFATKATHSQLSEQLVVHKTGRLPRLKYFLRAESYYNLASEIENLGVSGYGDKKLHQQSHGEGVMSLIEQRFEPQGLYLFDEPEAGLSPSRQMTLLRIFDQLIKEGSQLIVATHSPILLAHPEALIYQFSSSGIEEVSYQETSCFQDMQFFIRNTEQMVYYMLEN